MNFNLIHLLNTLNSAEKRYCNLYLKTFSNKNKTNKSLSDFNTLQRIAKNPKDVKKNIPEGNSTRLYYKILDALFLFHQDTILPGEKQYIRRARILYNKGLYKEAYKITDKILKQNPNENHLLKIEVIEMRILNALKASNVDYLNSDFHNDKKILDELSKEYFNLVDYETLWASFKLESTTSYFFGTKGTTKSLLLRNEDQAISPAAKVLFNKIKGFISIKEGNYPAANFHANRTKFLYEQFPYLIKKDPGDYLRSIRNICISLIFNKMYPEAEQLIYEIETNGFEFTKHKNADVITEYFTLLVLIKLDIIIASGKIPGYTKEVVELESKYNNLKELLPLNEKLNANISFSLINIHGGNYRKALKQINYVLKEAEKFRKDVFHLALMSELVVHFFLDNIQLLESKLNSFKRHTNEPDLPFGFEKEVPHLLGKIIQFPEEKTNYVKLHETITKSLEAENKSVYKNFISLYLINYHK
jgi:tetratricopeptide (TPR) repeat protein